MDSIRALAHKKKNVLLKKEAEDLKIRVTVADFLKTIDGVNEDDIKEVYLKGSGVYIIARQKNIATEIFLKKETLLREIKKTGIPRVENIVVM